MEGSDSGHEGKVRGVCIPPGTICTRAGTGRAVQTPAEISEARLRTGMDLEAPHAPPIFEISQDWVVAQSLYQHSSKPTQLRLQCQLPAAQGP